MACTDNQHMNLHNISRPRSRFAHILEQPPIDFNTGTYPLNLNNLTASWTQRD
jgi:hypothetical protein